MSWMLLWKIVFIAGVIGFSVMAIWVTIAGARDVRRLFQRLDESHRSRRQDD
jgi:hypothetical protein